MDLATSLLALDRVDDATVVYDAFPEEANETMPYSALIGAAIAASRGGTDVATYLQDAVELEARFAQPLFDQDSVVLSSLVAFNVGRPELAAEALGATRGKPQRLISMFALRRHLRALVRESLGDDEFGRLLERGSGRPARQAFAALVDVLAATPN